MCRPLERFSHLYSDAIAAVADVICAFRWAEELEGDGHECRDLIEASGPSGAQERFQFGEYELDGIEIGTVRRQKSEVRSHGFDRPAYLGLFVDGQVVEDDDIAWPERWHQDLFDRGAKTFVVDRAVKHRRRRDRIEAQGGNNGAGFPVTARRVIAEPGPTRAPTVAAQEIRRNAALIQEQVLPRIAERQPVAPLAPLSRDVGAALFVGVNRFF